MIRDPYIGMPIIMGEQENRPSADGFCNMLLGSLPIAMAYVPIQQWKTVYPQSKALERGTVFPELDLPFMGGRMNG